MKFDIVTARKQLNREIELLKLAEKDLASGAIDSIYLDQYEYLREHGKLPGE